MRLVVGLGNPGAQYAATRHNVGFAVLDQLARLHRFEAPKVWKRAEVSRGQLGGVDTLLVKPLTFMNCSGEAVSAIVRFYKEAVADLVVVHDEMAFAPGRVRLKSGGGHGGHNGLRSISQHVGPDFCRVRVGIGSPAQASRGAYYVLAPFDAASLPHITSAVHRACSAVQAIVEEGLAAAMKRFNTDKVASTPSD